MARQEPRMPGWLLQEQADSLLGSYMCCTCVMTQTFNLSFCNVCVIFPCAFGISRRLHDSFCPLIYFDVL